MKTVIITGGSDGLGYAVARLLAKSHNVYILARNEKKLIKIAKELNCKYKLCDVTNWSNIESVIGEINQESKSIDILINNAGIWIQGQLQENSSEKIKDVIEINTLGTILVSKAVVPAMKKQKSGIILNVISQAGLTEVTPIY